MKCIRFFILICSVFAISACANTKLYSDTYGFAEDNPVIYNAHKKECSDDAYRRYPVINPPRLQSPPRDLPRDNEREIEHANRVLEDIAHHNQVMMDEYHSYNNSRSSYERQCINQKGWYYVVVEDEEKK